MSRLFTWLLIVLALAALAADWPTYRGNNARTGAADDQPGPKAPSVLWVHEARDQFFAAPAPAGADVILSGLGAFNTASVYALSTDAATPQQRIRWAKIPPFLKLPTVSSPAVTATSVILGDGMHQTDGASLHALHPATGLLRWRYSIPGQLVHLEGTPAVVGDRVYFGAGHAGVLCLDASRLSLQGTELSAEESQKALDAKWKELIAAYEADKKNDPDLAIPPSDDALPKPSPKLVWQQGQGKWHVDAPVAVAGDKVVLASAYLDVEKTGVRAIVCVSAKDGATLWKVPVNLNPWGGPAIAGDVVVVGGSNIRLDPHEIPQGKGEVTALSLTDGKPLWRRDVPGGVVSAVAIAGEQVVFTATDGKVRGLSLTAGTRVWTYDAGAPLFAAPAIAAGVVYTADLKGVVHACQLADGKPLWKLSLAAEPVKAQGMIFGSPLIAKGKIFVATCDPEGKSTRNVVVCLGDK